PLAAAIRLGEGHQRTYSPHAPILLRPRRKRPRRRAPEPRDEFPPSHPQSPVLIGGAYRGLGCLGNRGDPGGRRRGLPPLRGEGAGRLDAWRRTGAVERIDLTVS